MAKKKCTIYRYNPLYKNCLVQYFNEDLKLAYNGYMQYGLVKELKELLVNAPIILASHKKVGTIKNIRPFEIYMSKTMTRSFKCSSAESFISILRYEKYGRFGRDQDPQQLNLF